MPRIHGADALLLAGDVPSRREPNAQRSARLVEDRPGGYAALVSASAAEQSPSGRTPWVVRHATRRTTKSAWPSKLLQIRRTGPFAGKPVLEVAPRLRIIVASDRLDAAHSAIVSLAELSG